MPRYDPNTGQLETYQPGPFDDQHLYLQWGGKLPGNESWSCGLRMADVAEAGVAADAAAMLAGVSTAVQAYHQNAATMISIGAKLSFVKLNHIGLDGKYTLATTNEVILGDISGGYTPTTVPPNQITLAVSLTTDVSRGLAHRGRYYLPLVGAPTQADGLITAAHRDQIKGTTTTFIAALNAVNATWDVAVFSRKQGAPTHRIVTGNEIGRVLDTQRRRRRKLTELWD